VIPENRLRPTPVAKFLRLETAERFSSTAVFRFIDAAKSTICPACKLGQSQSGLLSPDFASDKLQTARFSKRNRNWRSVLQTARATLTLNFRPADSSRIYGELGALLVTTRGVEQYAISL